MKTKRGFRSGMGFGQIMAMMLVVMPALAFSVTILFDYWSVMQADYKLKLIANYVSERANSAEDLTAFSSSDRGLCPRKDGAPTALVFSNQGFSTNANNIDITINYTYDGTYIKNKLLSTSIHTYSYHDLNMSITGTCQ